MNYRVAVAHGDDDHPNSGAFTYRAAQERLEDAERLLAEAKAEFPVREGYTHWIEERVTKGERSSWTPIADEDEEGK